MTSQVSCLRCLSQLILVLGISFASVPIAQADESANVPSYFERFCNPPSGPSRGCPPFGPVAHRPVTPEEIEKIKKDLDRAEQEYQAQPKPVPQTGILPEEMVGSALGAGSSAYRIENGWHDIVNGKSVMVYAGATRFDPTNDVIKYDPMTVHGFVIIIKGLMSEPDATWKQLYTPTAVGSLHITAANGNVLTLESRQGNKLSLNVETEQLTPLSPQ